MSEKKLPHWDLSPIYPGPESAEFENDLKRVFEISAKLEKISSDPSVPIIDILKLFDEGAAVAITVGAYSHALYSTDASNAIYLKAMGKAEEAEVALSAAQDVLIFNVAKRADEFSAPELAPYALFLNEIKVLSEHQMSLEEEKLAGEFLRVSASAWSRLQGSVTSTISEGDKTLIELRGIASSADRAARKDAFERELKILEEHQVAIASALNGVKGTVLLLEKRRGWNDPLERSVFTSRITMKALNALIEALEDSREMFREYLRTKAKLMGVEKLEFYDLFAPVGSASREYSFQEGAELVYNAYNSFSPEAGAFIRNAIDNNWIDAEPRKGKRGGAYDTSFPLVGQSRVFMNYDGSYDSISTLAHELGHAYHDSMVKDLPVSQADYPMTLAETASIFGENLLFEDVMANSSKEEQLPVLEQYVQGACQVCIDILSRFYFEREVFKRRKNGELTAAEMCEIMLKAQEDTYGDAIGTKHPYMWAVKSHYYSEGFSFYNYPYAFGQLFALGLFASRNDVPDFPKYYRDILRSTGSKTAVEVTAAAGIDIEDKAFWMKGINLIGTYAEKLKEWL